MFGIALEIKHRCLGCSAWVQVTGCVERVACAACAREVPLPPALWPKILAEPLVRVPVHPDVGDSSGYGGDDALRFELVYARQDPPAGQLVTTRGAPPHLLALGITTLVSEGNPRWYAMVADVAALRRSHFEWSSVNAACLDADGNLYGTGSGNEADEGFGGAIWCIGADRKVRWYQLDEDLVSGGSGDHIAVDTHGRVLLQVAGKHSLRVLSPTDGAPRGKLGGKEPDGAPVHHLDVAQCGALCADPDGTIVALLGGRLLRFAKDGTGVATWPPRSGLFGKKAEKLRPLFGPGRERIEVGIDRVESLGHHPPGVADASALCIGWDGSLFAASSDHVARFDRSGKRLYRIDLASTGRIGADREGRLHALCELPGDPRPRVVKRISPDGDTIDTIATDRLAGGTVGAEDRILVAADGTIHLLGTSGAWRILAPDGTLRHQSAASLRADAAEDKRIDDNS